MVDSIGSKMEICETSGVHIGMVLRFQKMNVYFKRKLRVLRTQKCIALVCGNPHQPVRVCKLPRFMGGSIRPRMEICQISGLPFSRVPCLHQSNGYIKRKLRIWIAQKSIAEKGNIQNFWPINLHDTAFALKQWLYQKEAMGMQSSKLYRSSRCRNSTV